ncbi:transposase [Kitasatospora aureofaciens]|uniref:transposase n=1 Tax=Kitasatospora aureofaciens TaxID=1894 RepID=UPI0037C742FB
MGQAHVRGPLLDGKRKSVEPMAARLGEDGNRQALVHFVPTSPWDPAHVRARLSWRVQDAIDAGGPRRPGSEGWPRTGGRPRSGRSGPTPFRPADRTRRWQHLAR